MPYNVVTISLFIIMSSISFDEFLKKYNLGPTEDDLKYKEQINDMLTNPEKFATIDENSEEILLCWTGIWYQYHDKNFDLEEKYYVMSLGKNNCKYTDWTYKQLVKLQIENKNPELADKYGLQALEHFKDNNEVRSKLAYKFGNMFDSYGRKNLAEQYMIKAADLGHQNAIYRLANFYDNNNNFVAGEKYYLLGIEQGNMHMMNNLALMYKKIGNRQKAEQYFKMAIEKGNTVSMYNLGYLYVDMNQYDDAEQYFMMCLDANNFNVDRSFNDLLYLYARLNKLDKIDNLINKYPELHNKPDIANTIGNIYLQKNNYDLAEKYLIMSYEQYQKRDEKEKIIKSSILLSLTEVYINKNQYELAEKFCQIAIDNNVLTSIRKMMKLYKYFGKAKDTNIEELCMKYIDSEILGQEAIDTYEQIVGNSVKFYNILSKLKPNKIIEQKMKYLRTIKEVHFYVNKINLLAKDGICPNPSCKKETKLIPRDCAHSYCFSCYVDEKCCLC